MDQLLRLKDSVIDYLSPKRRRTVGPGTPSQGTEQHSYEPASEPQGKKARNALHDRIHAKLPSPSDTRFGPGSRKRPRKDESNFAASNSHHTDSEISPDESASQITAVEESEVELVSDHLVVEDELGEEIVEDLEEEAQVSPEDKVAEYLARQAELALRKEAIAEVKAKGNWHSDEVFLFERLSMRSFEELFPAEWKVDFPTLPGLLFTPSRENTFINYNCGSSASGFKALQRIFNLGWRVKDKADLRIPTERFISTEIQRYIKWSEVDGGYRRKRFIPVLTVVAARPREAIDSISKKITDQMDFLAEKHRLNLTLSHSRINEVGETEVYLRHPPLLYGIIVAQTKAIFVTLDSSDLNAKLRHIAHVDFKEEGHAVWNGLAVALVSIVARNYMMSIKDELEDDEEIDDDPDA